MRKAASLFVGMNDFRSFAAADPTEEGRHARADR
jgi:tRNA U38,U39,U40 pseudouridine synthase TruA